MDICLQKYHRHAIGAVSRCVVSGDTFCLASGYPIDLHGRATSSDYCRGGGPDLSATFRRGIQWYVLLLFLLRAGLGGGGKSNKERAEARKYLEQWLVDVKVRVAACLLMSVWVATCNVSMPEPLMMIFNMNTDFARTVTPWNLGGLYTDAARICFNVLLLASFLAIMFMLPAWELVASTGSRTLYVYVLHIAMLVSNPALHWLPHYSRRAGGWYVVWTGIISVIFTLLLGSRLMKAILHYVVQPQWLVDLMIPEDKKDAPDSPLTPATAPDSHGHIKQGLLSA